MRTLKVVPPIVEEYYQGIIHDEFGLKKASGKYYKEVISGHPILIYCSPCDTLYQAIPPAKTSLKSYKDGEDRISIIQRKLNDDERYLECPECYARRIKKAEEEQIRVQQDEKTKRVELLEHMISEIQSNAHYFWYTRFFNQQIQEAGFTYNDDWFYERQVLHLAERHKPYIYNAKISYCFYRTPHIVRDAAGKKSYNITVKSLIRRFLSSDPDDWNIHYSCEPENLIELLLEEFPELDDFEYQLYTSLTSSYHAKLVDESVNVVKMKN